MLLSRLMHSGKMMRGCGMALQMAGTKDAQDA
jgi:hypothetical protein